MKLHDVHITEYKSVWDSQAFEVGNVTCLVGKNEAGKTSILQALYRLNPIIDGDGTFDVTDDYPRSAVEDYQQDVETKRREEAIVTKATFKLDSDELELIEQEYGTGVLTRPAVTVSKGYAKSEGKNTLWISLPVDEQVAVKHLVTSYALPTAAKDAIGMCKTIAQLAARLAEAGAESDARFAEAQAKANQLPDETAKASALEESKALAESEQSKKLRARLAEILKSKTFGIHVWSSILRQHFPKFLYFDEYYQMRGHDNVEALKRRKESNELEPPDHPLLGLIDLARLDLDKLLATTRTQELKNKLQGASNHLSSQILKYWSQNKHLRMNFDVRPALAGDPEGMREGTNIWGEVFDSKHLVSTSLGTRSRGFVWFFSFLAWYSAVKKGNEPLVLLLDEPGLSLHGKAQEDLLRYFEEEVANNPKHQLVYTTHSPFMVDPRHFDRVRIVQDSGIDSDEPLSRDQDGTKVFTEVLEAGPDSLFPLQGALGYEIYQSLFIGPNCLVVEGVSDLLYLQTMTGVLSAEGREGLAPKWTITPVGGSDKVPTFVALVGSQRNLNVATLIDFQKADQQTIENLYKKKLLRKSHVLTFADFTGKTEADIEDMFDVDLYLQLVNGEFSGALSKKVKSSDLTSQAPRVLVRIEEHFSKHPLKGGASFSHYRPARYLAEKVSTMKFTATTLDQFEAAFKAINKLLG